MAKTKEDIGKEMGKLDDKIKENKKIADTSINAIINRLAKLEKETESLTKEKDAWKKEKEQWEKEKEKEKEEWKKEKEEMKEQIDLLRASIASLTPEEGEIKAEAKEALKEEITKALTTSMENKLEATKEGWVEVVKKNIKEEAKEEAKKDEVLIIHTTIEEEKMRQARRLNIRVTGIKEEEGSTPESDGKTLCEILGYKEGEIPFSKAWRVGKDPTKRALILQFTSLETRTSFIRKRAILRDLEGPTIYLDDDLTKLQQDHRRACMPRVHQARKEGKKATYRDGRVIIDGKPIA